CEVGRNAEGRMRVLSIDVVLRLGKAAAEVEHLDRILGQFEPFCTVSQSISAGVPVHVSVRDGRDAVLKD
ncbi:MAG: OsmC family peroxiredoxin, partial [Microvirgula sp.]